MLCSADSEGVFTLAVGRGLEAMGVGPRAVVGRSIFEVFRRDPGLVEDARRALGGETFSTVRKVRGRSWEVGYAPLPNAGAQDGVVGFIAVAVDVTERERSEEALRLRDRAFASSPNGII